MTILERLGAHAVSGYGEGLPGPLREAVRLHLADTVGAWIAGGAIAEGRLLQRFEGGESVPGRVALNCALARLSEVDDIHLASATTPGAIVVPAAITLAATPGSHSEALAEAIAAGYDLMTGLGAALEGPTALYRGIWPTYFAAPFGVAAVAARLLGLTKEEAAHALAIALAFSSPSVGRQSGASMSRWLAVGNAARNGVTAALAAQAGFTGDLGLLEGDFLSGVYAMPPRVDALLEALEQHPAVTQTSVKPWCAAKQTMAATQALREIIDEGTPPSEMASLVVGVPPPTLKMIDHGVVPSERASHLTSVSYQMALAAFDANTSLGMSKAPESLPEEISAFMARISVVPDEDLLGHYPRSWPARLAVETSKGRREKLVVHVPGDPERPFDELQVAAKFWRISAPLVGDRAAEELVRLSFAALYGEQGPRALLDAIDRAVAALGPLA